MAELYGDLTTILSALAAGRADHQDWVGELRTAETTARDREKAELADDRIPLHPMRVYAELAPMLDRDAVVVIDAGDFGSYAGRVIDSYQPGCWLDSGPFGCLGSGPGYALAAKLARPDRQVVLLQGDGAFGFSGMEWDTLVRHNVPVVSVIGNNGIWALEKHPMEALYGYSVVAELRPGTRYDEVVRALGAHGELVAPRPSSAGARACVRQWSARRRQRAHRSQRRLSAPIESGLTSHERTLGPGTRSRTVDLCQRPPAPIRPSEQPILAPARRQHREEPDPSSPRSPLPRSTTRKPPISKTKAAQGGGPAETRDLAESEDIRSSLRSRGKRAKGRPDCGHLTCSCSGHCACLPVT